MKLRMEWEENGGERFMIKTGTRVIVLTSSSERKIGPRKGSIGYVTQLEKSGKNIFYNNDEDVFVHLTKVIFTRYGFEVGKRRRETKFFLNIFPSFLMPLGLKNPTKSIDAHIDRVKDIKIFGTPFWDGLSGRTSVLYGKGNVYGGTLMPLPFAKADLIRVKRWEFESWLNSFVTDRLFHHVLYLITTAPVPVERLKHILNLGMVNQLREMYRDRDYRDHMLQRLSASRAKRSEVVGLVRRITSIAYTPEYRKDLSDMKLQIEAVSLGKMVQPTSVVAATLMMKDLYSDTEFSLKTDLLMTANHKRGGQKIMAMLTYLSKMRNRLGCLAQALEEGNDDRKRSAGGGDGWKLNI